MQGECCHQLPQVAATRWASKVCIPNGFSRQLRQLRQQLIRLEMEATVAIEATSYDRITPKNSFWSAQVLESSGVALESENLLADPQVINAMREKVVTA
jgi:hypothetical protein